jgi:hypothetical protein
VNSAACDSQFEYQFVPSTPVQKQPDIPHEYDATALGVTVWENGIAAKKLPTDMFRGEMDAWWECDGTGDQRLIFIGERRRALGVDVRRS